MKYIRIIPRLDIKGPNLVKGVHLEGLRVLGKPEEFGHLVAFLSSARSSYITGTTMLVDGGLVRSMV